jgi:Flp pilus assembly protein TadD
VEILNHSTEDLNSPPARTSRAPSRPRVELELEDLYCILQANPNDSRAALKLALRLCEANRDQEALKILRNVVKIDSCFETVMALGLTEYKLDMEEEASKHLHEALLIAPDEAAGLFEIFKTLGNIFVRRRDFDSAEDSYNKAYRLFPDSDVLLVNLGTLCIQRSNWDEAIQRFRSALQISNVNDKAWVGLGIGHRMKGDFELAWGNLEAALEYNPVNEVALTLALDWAPADGKESRALELLRNFLVNGGWNERFSLAFAWLSWKRGDSDLARLELERLLAVNPGHGKALELVRQVRSQT